MAFIRSTHSRHDFADRSNPKFTSPDHDDLQKETDNIHDHHRPPLQPRDSVNFESSSVIVTKGQEGQRVYGRPFVTAGWVVVGVTAVVATVEVGLLILVLKI